jgi:hypothetical protein
MILPPLKDETATPLEIVAAALFMLFYYGVMGGKSK